MSDIFISYKVHNRVTAINYYKKLKDLNYNVWFDQLVPKGGVFKEHIEQNIKNTKLVICLLSKECLIDDWVIYQIRLAKKYNKKIVYITLDDTDWSKHSEYILNNRLYSNIEKINIDKLIKPKEFKHTIANIIYSTLLLTLGIFLLFKELSFFNLKLNNINGYILIGCSCALALAILNNKKINIISNLLGIIFIALIVFILPPNYISGVSINSIFFLLFYLIGYYITYSRYNILLSLLFGICYSILLSSFSLAIMIAVEYYLSFDITWITILILAGYLFFNYFKILKQQKLS